MLSHPVIKEDLLSTEELNMKLLGDTAADIYGSKTNSFSIKEEKEQFD